ncbi:MAG: helix-turn-helix domain-containing protein [Anaerolineales bacterium]
MIFTFEKRSSDSPFVKSIWRTQSERRAAFISTAAIHWEIVLMSYQGKTSVTVRGPETKATVVPIPAEAEWLGITFKLGTFMPDWPPGRLLDMQDVNLPAATGKFFFLHGSTWEFPSYENADTFVTRLERDDLLGHDPLIAAVRQGRPPSLSLRSIQYHFLRATGLTQKKIRQIERARRAAALLSGGMPILDTVHETGYFDQSHLTNGLRRFIGRTPAQILCIKTGG